MQDVEEEMTGRETGRKCFRTRREPSSYIKKGSREYRCKSRFYKEVQKMNLKTRKKLDRT